MTLRKPKPQPIPTQGYWVTTRVAVGSEIVKCSTCNGKGRGIINDSKGCVSCGGTGKIENKIFRDHVEDITIVEDYNLFDFLD